MSTNARRHAVCVLVQECRHASERGPKGSQCVNWTAYMQQEAPLQTFDNPSTSASTHQQKPRHQRAVQATEVTQSQMTVQNLERRRAVRPLVPRNRTKPMRTSSIPHARTKLEPRSSEQAVPHAGGTQQGSWGTAANSNNMPTGQQFQVQFCSQASRRAAPEGQPTRSCARTTILPTTPRPKQNVWVWISQVMRIRSASLATSGQQATLSTSQLRTPPSLLYLAHGCMRYVI